MASRELLFEVSYRSLGYGEDKDFWRRLEQLLTDKHVPRLVAGYWLAVAPIAYYMAVKNGRYDPVDGFRRKGTLADWKEQHSRTLREFEQELDFKIPRSELSEFGRDVFL